MGNYNAIYALDTGEFFHEDNMDSYIISMTIPFLADERIVFKRRRKDAPVQPFSPTNKYNHEIWVHYQLNERQVYWDAGVVYLGCRITYQNQGYIQRPNPYLFLLAAFDASRANGFIE